jgi:hypothetical protein
MGSIGWNELRALAADALTAHPPERVLCGAVAEAAAARGLPREHMFRLRLFEAGGAASGGPRLGGHFDTEKAPVLLGLLFEALLDVGTNRKRSGSFFTPAAIAATTVEAALAPVCRNEIHVCDPAMGGGAFLLAAGEWLAARGVARRQIVERCLAGVDVDALAVAVTEAALWLWAADADLDPVRLRARLSVTNALEPGWEHAFVAGTRGFDLVVGNPPWVAYAGRAAKPLAPEERRRLGERFRAFRGYPTLHGLFVERAATLAPNGTVALLLPSPVADLDGYRPVRRALAASHTPREPLLELGQDAFIGVTQPSFALIADAGALAGDGQRPWRLVERQRARTAARRLEPPAVLDRIAARPSFPRELFGELGFQSAGVVSRSLFLRADSPDERHTVPLLEGREVREFHVGAPRLFLEPDPEVLASSRCRLRPAEQYGRAAFVVRQTAKYPIAALHSGLPFRNTLLAGYSHEAFPPEVVVALLNSSLYRALHLALWRDARQAAFPQVKVAHLRALPAPPASDGARGALSELTSRMTRLGVTPSSREALDRVVFDLFEIGAHERAAIVAFLHERAPELAPGQRARRATPVHASAG